MANRAAGKGYENEDYYTNIKLLFIGIENIHVMRSSQQKIVDGEHGSVCVRVCVLGGGHGSGEDLTSAVLAQLGR